MKKLLVLLFLVFLLLSCGESKEIQDAKKEIFEETPSFERFEDDNSKEINELQEQKEVLYEIIPSQDPIEESDFVIDEEVYGEKVIEENSFSYENIPGLTIQKVEDFGDLSCENINDFLAENNGWYYWNTCRAYKQENFSVNVITLKGEEYLYEKYYFDLENNLYGKVLLESGEGVTSDDLAQKNSELKENEYEIEQVVNDIFLQF